MLLLLSLCLLIYDWAFKGFCVRLWLLLVAMLLLISLKQRTEIFLCLFVNKAAPHREKEIDKCINARQCQIGTMIDESWLG